ncbi:MAG: permease [Patescibacteria group bacterium]|jgi:hypothetical protein
MSIFAPIQWFADWITYGVFHITEKTLLADAVDFFIFDTIKIFLLLSVIIFVVSYLRTYLPPEKVRHYLADKNSYFASFLAAIFGIATPFCTCSAIPLFLGFVEAGVPLGATFSFLVSSPMVNEVALVLLFGLFGWKIALLYAFSGIVIATLAGIAIGKMNIEHLLEDFVLKNRTKNNIVIQKMTMMFRYGRAIEYTFDILKKIWPYIVVGVGVGAWIHGYVPTDFLASYAGADKWYAVPLATLLGIPLYSNAAGVIPLVKVLTEKGVAIGTTLAFMMAVTGLSLPEFMILKKVMKPKLILIFASVVGAGIIFTGYLFNAVLG